MAKIKILNANGEEEEIEAFTQDEVTAKIDDVKKEYDTKINEKDNILKTLENEKTELEKKLGGTKEDNPNFKALKDALDKKEEDIKSLRTDLDSEKTSRRNSFIGKLTARLDDETKKKVQLHMDKTLAGMKGDTDEELTEKVQAAIKLSRDENSQGIFDSGMGGGKGEEFGGGTNGVEFTSREKALGAKLGIKDEDYKKYGPRIKNKN